MNITSSEHGRLHIELEDSPSIAADKVVLAIGNYPPADPPAADSTFYESSLYARDPWEKSALDVAGDQPVLLVGTGLTMLDIALALRDRGHQAPIYAISRRGLLPQPHRVSSKPPPHHDRPQTLDSWPRTTLGLLKELRREVATASKRGVDWREVVTSLRADTPALWQSLSMTERERFLRHLRPFWETHRHRAAPAIADSIDELRSMGILQVLAGRILSYAHRGNQVDVHLRKRGLSTDASLRVSKVINCTGPNTDLASVSDPLIANLRAAGWIRPDALGLGIDTDSHGAVIRRDGKPCSRLFLIGPLRKGVLWENTAVPELRLEAGTLAAHLAWGRDETTGVIQNNRDRMVALQC